MHFKRCRKAASCVMTRHPLLFLRLLRQIISDRCSVRRGNPGPPTLGEQQNSGTPAIMFAVFRCFSLFLETSARRMIAYSHGHNYIKPEAFCQFDTCHFRIYLDRHYPSLLSLASELSV